MVWSLSFRLLPDEVVVEDSLQKKQSGLKPVYSVFLTNRRAIFRFDGLGSSMTQSFSYDEILDVVPRKRLFVSYIDVKTAKKNFLFNTADTDYWSKRILEVKEAQFLAGPQKQTTSPSIRSTADKQETVYVAYIVATPDKLWAALTDPEFTRQYFFGRRVESDWKVGSSFVLWMEDGRIDSQGKVLACDPPRMLSVTWHVEWLDEFRHLPEAVVTFQIDPLGEVVRLTMTESHPEPIDDKFLKAGRRGWPVIISGLKSLLETGRPLPAFDFPA